MFGSNTNSSSFSNMNEQQNLPLQFRTLNMSDRREPPLHDVSNRQYLTPRWRDLGSPSGSLHIPLPSFDNENSPQVRYMDLDDSTFVTPTSRRGPISRSGPASLPYLPAVVDDEVSPMRPVRLAPRYYRTLEYDQ